MMIQPISTVDPISAGPSSTKSTPAPKSTQQTPQDTVHLSAQAQATLGPISVLVHNAGVDKPFGPIGVYDPDDWWRAQNVHVRGALLFMHACLPAMRAARRGRIINMASAAAVIVGANTSAYCCAKAALVRLTEHVDQEIKPHGLCAFAVQPGTIATQMMDDSLSDPVAQEWAPGMMAQLEHFKALDPEPELRRLGRQFVALACGDHDAASGRYIDLEAELLPVG